MTGSDEIENLNYQLLGKCRSNSCWHSPFLSSLRFQQVELSWAQLWVVIAIGNIFFCISIKTEKVLLSANRGFFNFEIMGKWGSFFLANIIDEKLTSWKHKLLFDMAKYNVTDFLQHLHYAVCGWKKKCAQLTLRGLCDLCYTCEYNFTVVCVHWLCILFCLSPNL